MTRNEALYKVKGYLTDIIPVENYSEVEEIIKALEQESCEDCISRQAAIKAIHNFQAEEIEYHYYKHYAEEAIRPLPSANRSTEKWISVSKKLPERSVLCCGGHGEFIIGYLGYEDDQFICENENEIMYDPIAWMPLPKPYKVESEDKK